MKLDATTVIVVGVAAFLLLRQPAHAAPPPPYYQQPPPQPRQPGDPPPSDAHWISQLGYGLGTIGSMITQAVGNLGANKQPTGGDVQASNATPEASAAANAAGGLTGASAIAGFDLDSLKLTSGSPYY